MTDAAQYRQALDTLPHLVWVAGPDGGLEHLNRRCLEYAGLPLDDLLGWDWGWVVHPADLPGSLVAWTAAVRSGNSLLLEQRLRRADGQYRWHLCRAEPLRDADGRVVRWYGTCTDIEAVKHAEAEFRAERAVHRALVERSPDGLAVVGPDGTVRYANPAAGGLLGFAPDDLVGTDLWGTVHPDDRAAVAEWLERVLAGPGVRLETAARFWRPGGVERRLQVGAANLVVDPDVRGLAVTLRPAAPADAAGPESGGVRRPG